MKIQVHYLFSLFVVFHAILLSIYLLSKKKLKNTENYLFSSIFLVFAVVILVSLSTSYGISVYFYEYHKPIFLLRHLTLILIPLLYFYIREFATEHNFKLKNEWKHFIPFVVFEIYFFIRIVHLDEFNLFRSDLKFESGFVILVQNVIYLVLSIKLLKKDKLKGSKKESKLLGKWFKILVVGFLFMWFIQFSAFLLVDIVKQVDLCPYTSGMYFVAAFFMIYFIIYITLESAKIFTIQTKYSYSNTPENDLKELFKIFEKYFFEKSVYKDPDLSLNKIADELAVSPKQLSQSINMVTQGTFKDFVNETRLEESEKLLSRYSKKEMSISEIFYSVGFNSKSAFNTYFKKKYGMTPTQYREKKGSETGF